MICKKRECFVPSPKKEIIRMNTDYLGETTASNAHLVRLKKLCYLLTSSRHRVLSIIVSFALVLASTLADAQTRPDQARKIVPIIAFLLDDDSVSLRIGSDNDNVLDSKQYPNGVVANFATAPDSLDLSFTVTDLQPGQFLVVKLNGNVVGKVTSNGAQSFTLPIEYMDSLNELEFIPSPGATWTISEISLLQSEGPKTRAEAVRFLNRATFGASEASISRILELGYEAWLDEQLELTPTLHTPFYLTAVNERAAAGIQGASQRCAAKMDAWWNGAIKGEDQVRQRMAFALSEIFVVGDSACNTTLRHGFTNYYDILIRNGFGSYRDLLGEVTLNQVMGGWLSLRGSNVNPVYNNQADENYAREVMQLFSIGVYELNLDGSVKLQNGKPIETYDNEIITNMARALPVWLSGSAAGMTTPLRIVFSP